MLRWLALPLGGCCRRIKKRRKRRRRRGGKEERTRVRRRGSDLGFIGEKGSGVGGRRRGDGALAGGERCALSVRTRTTARTVIGPGGPRPGGARPKCKVACGQDSSFSSLSLFLFPQIFLEKGEVMKKNKTKAILFYQVKILTTHIFCKLVYLLDKNLKLVLFV